MTNTRQVWDKIGKHGGDSACSCVQVGTTKALLVIVVPCMLPPERERETTTTSSVVGLPGPYPAWQFAYAEQCLLISVPTAHSI